VVVATSEKVMSIYSLSKYQNLLNFYLDDCGFNCMKYFESFQALLVSGYENVIKVFTFTPEKYELNCVGRLVGHVGIIDAIEIIKDTAMVISSDDKGVAKLWDIRKLGCVQTITLDNKANVRTILHLNNQDKVAVVGDRINTVDFEHDLTRGNMFEAIIPMSFHINEETFQLLVSTKNEVRLIDLTDGQVKSIFVNMIQKEQPDEITYFNCLPKKSQFMLGDFNGAVGFFNSSNSLQLNICQPHAGSITSIKYDDLNNLILTASIDGSMALQIEKADLPIDQPDEMDDTEEREEYFGKPIMHQANMMSIMQNYNKQVNLEKENLAIETARKRLAKENTFNRYQSTTGLETLRSIERANHDTEIALAELSVYHNMIALATNVNKVYLYNYETFKPIDVIEVAEDAEVVAILFLTGYSKLIVSTSKGHLHFVTMTYNTPTKLDVIYDLVIDLRTCTYVGTVDKKTPCQGYGNRLLSDLCLVDEVPATVRTMELQNSSKTLMQVSEQLSLQQAYLYVGESSGVVCCFDLEAYLRLEVKYKPYSVNPNYNAFRRANEDFMKLASTLEGKLVDLSKLTPKYDYSKLSKMNIKNFKATRQKLTDLHLSKTNQRLLMMTSLDSTFRVYTETGQMLCHLNLNHPLPIKWDFEREAVTNKTAKVIFALKTVELLSQRYNKPDKRAPINIRRVIEIYTNYDFQTFSMTSIDQEELRLPHSHLGYGDHRKLHSINVLFEEKATKPETKPKPKQGLHKPIDPIPNPSRTRASQALTMKDLFTPKDMFFDKIKSENREEIQGPTLRQLETMRRAKNIFQMSDPLYGKTEQTSEPQDQDYEDTEKLFQQSTLAQRVEYEEPMEMEQRKRRVQNSFATKVTHRLAKVDQQIAERVEAELLKRPDNYSIASASRRHVDIIDLKKRVSKLGYSPKPFLSSRRTLKVSAKAPTESLPPIESTVHDASNKSKIDMFDYATEKNLFHEDSTSVRDMFRSQVLHESSHLTTSTKNLLNLDRRQEKRLFQDIMRELDRRKLRAKASSRLSHNESQFSKYTGRDGESTILPSVTSMARKLPSSSLPRIKR
jgi:WD40 repeat protein